MHNLAYRWVCTFIRTSKYATCETGFAYSSWAHETTHSFSWGLCCFVCSFLCWVLCIDVCPRQWGDATQLQFGVPICDHHTCVYNDLNIILNRKACMWSRTFQGEMSTKTWLRYKHTNLIFIMLRPLPIINLLYMLKRYNLQRISYKKILFRN